MDPSEFQLRQVLETIERAHAPVVATALAACEPRIIPALRVPEAVTRAALAAAGLPASDAILAFEALYGGLVCDLTADGRGRIEEPVLRFGAYACVTSQRAPDAYFASTEYAPVVFTWGDIAYVMDAAGRAYAANLDTAAWPFAPDGRALVARIALYDAIVRLRTLGAPADGGAHYLELEGLRADELARTLGVPSIPEATDETARFFGDGVVFIVDETADGPSAAEQPVTLIASSDPSRLARISR
ncbi:MAG: hypothetical protein IPN17_32480 [Deltaproteobacteria bacterium]|jgi:hypothetical protein|nr:hypothetical protein [Deltaproteobacteria bacterium]MBK7068282.1 hypothetical protein [Deltaproteobacteria bacterium]MBK8696855.1 hypothetical protein [Deltaproteobacteria bacterium]MBP6829827.1 hypothetical protein [Deltaproteobacteria bacterium]